MEHLYIEPSGWTPEVYFNIDENKLCLLGRSFPEDAATFYTPIVAWLEKNIHEFANGFTLEIQFEYFNTSSSKYLLKMFRFLELYKQANKISVQVVWKYFANDEEMKESGMEYQQFVDIPFEFIEIEK
ncbi:MAG: DUF1987 domain-containing protein [Bacteroidales bacterium]|nr:DUF1987 domain-containing protein [Bacteroidales bacterium]